jgi:hypothetical protein
LNRYFDSIVDYLTVLGYILTALGDFFPKMFGHTASCMYLYLQFCLRVHCAKSVTFISSLINRVGMQVGSEGEASI